MRIRRHERQLGSTRMQSTLYETVYVGYDGLDLIGLCYGLKMVTRL